MVFGLKVLLFTGLWAWHVFFVMGRRLRQKQEKKAKGPDLLMKQALALVSRSRPSQIFSSKGKAVFRTTQC